jgi:hypothetical protein
LNPINTLRHYFLNIYFNSIPQITHMSPEWSRSFRFLDWDVSFISHLPHAWIIGLSTLLKHITFHSVTRRITELSTSLKHIAFPSVTRRITELSKLLKHIAFHTATRRISEWSALLQRRFRLFPLLLEMISYPNLHNQD